MGQIVNSIMEKVTEAERNSINEPTHLMIPHSMINKLLEELSNDQILDEIDYDLIFQNGITEKIFSIDDIQTTFGLSIVSRLTGTDEVKVLSEIKTNY